jgi:SecD/SecF fusion protein
MEKRKKWQLALIVTVLALTLYNILPTIFYYSKPLSKPVTQNEAKGVASAIAGRVNGMEGQSIEWLGALAKNLKIKPKSIAPVAGDPKFIEMTFANAGDAEQFRKQLPRAGSLIPFAPAQLALGPPATNPNQVLVERAVSTNFPKGELENYFQFGTAGTELHSKLVAERAERVAVAAGGPSEPARILAAMRDPAAGVPDDMALALAQQVVEYDKAFGADSGIAQRFFASFSQFDGDKAGLIQTFVSRLNVLEKKHADDRRQLEMIERAQAIVKGNEAVFRSGADPLVEAKGSRIEIGARNPFIEAVVVEEGQLLLQLHDDVQKLREAAGDLEIDAYRADKLSQLLLGEMAYVSRVSGEAVQPEGGQFAVELSRLPGSESFMALDLGAVAKAKSEGLEHRLKSAWQPTSKDLAPESYPVLDYETFSALSPEKKQLGLVVYAPVNDPAVTPEGFRNSSIYVVARNMSTIAEKYRQAGQTSQDEPLQVDFQNLYELLTGSGFIGYPGSAYGLPAEFRNDFIFELGNYYDDLLAATREDFAVHGSQRYAVLEFTDQQQRILARNEIDTQMHEDLLKWRDEYQAAKVDMNLHAGLDVPPPTRNVFWDNLKLSTIKYFRGDDRKVLKWGLDLSGGKSVTIGLRDQSNKPVTDTVALKEGANELYNRVNKMGVSEVEIRVEGDHILMNFPGAQGLSASELVQGSTMTFHIVNEAFSPQNQEIAPQLGRFLQDVWNEAQVTDKTDAQSINEIAWRMLGGDASGEIAAMPRGPDAQALYEAGLQLANPYGEPMSSAFDDTVSSIAMWRGDSYAEWQGQPNPLFVVFHNYALDGTSLDNVHAEYDPSKGNMLVFGVKRSNVTADGAKLSPQADFYTWTAQFAQESVLGTPREKFSGGQGWRMAIVLNGTAISAPQLISPLSDRASVTGHFSQREVNQLVADLKAGSLTYTPKVVSERNVSPDLGKQEKTKGIIAAAVGLLLVIGCMSWYYRFAGIIASIAVMVNLLIMWGVLQNLEAALTLPGIAGIILTMGMAVDANVLVFERIREEFAATGRIASAVQAGYRKAFTAIVDSNITTIMAALILLHFDVGPIKAFAVTLIIGIVSSMFTALFMTRYFFAGWVQNPNHRSLNMMNMFKTTQFNFLSKARVAIASSFTLILIGMVFLFAQRHTMFGMDFTGGYSLAVNFEERADGNYRKATMDALLEAGVPIGQVEVRELNRPNQLRIQLGMGLEQPGEAFYQLPQSVAAGDALYPYQANPRINWVVEALEKGGLAVKAEQLPQLSDSWSVMSGQFSNTMRNNAIWGLGLALLSILIYITIRFEFKYAMSALIALSHDLLITVGAMAILHWMGVRVQIDLQVVGALMTIVGYSLNDTIVVFDRIRENGRLLRKLPFTDLINQSLNTTLNRTVMTSLTTLLVLVALVSFGGKAIFDFALVMTMGVVFGTFSSLFIASPVLLAFHRREQARQERQAA